MNKTTPTLIVLLVAATCLAGCIGNTPSGSHHEYEDHRYDGVKIGSKITTPEGLVLSTYVDKTQIVNRLITKVENPTNHAIKLYEAGVIYNYVDEDSMDHNEVWRKSNGIVGLDTTIESRYSEEFWGMLAVKNPISVRPYVRTDRGSYADMKGVSLNKYDTWVAYHDPIAEATPKPTVAITFPLTAYFKSTDQRSTPSEITLHANNQMSLVEDGKTIKGTWKLFQCHDPSIWDSQSSCQYHIYYSGARYGTSLVIHRNSQDAKFWYPHGGGSVIGYWK